MVKRCYKKIFWPEKKQEKRGRSSHWSCSIKRDVLKKFPKFAGKHRVSYEFCKHFTKTFLSEHLRTTASNKVFYQIVFPKNFGNLKKKTCAITCFEPVFNWILNCDLLFYDIDFLDWIPIALVCKLSLHHYHVMT